MKFVCDKCKTKYSIADEKVRRKVLKIRCKNCASIIVVRDPFRREGGQVDLPHQPRTSDPLEQAFDGAFGGGGVRRRSSTAHRSLAVAHATEPALNPIADDLDDPNQTQVSSMADALRPQDIDDEWYLSVDGHQFGPMSFDELGSRVKRGEARGDDAYVWRDGFDDWVEVSKVPELRPFAPPPPPPQRSGLFPSTEVENKLGDRPPATAASGIGRPTGPARSEKAPPPVIPPPTPSIPSRPRTEESSPAIAAPIPARPVAAGQTPPPMPAAVANPADPAPLSGGVAPLPVALEQGLQQLPASYGDRPTVTLPPQMVPVPAQGKTPALIKVAAVAGILSTLTGVAILVYFLFIDRPPQRRSQPATDLKKLAATEIKVRKAQPMAHPDAGTVKLEFPAVDIERSPKVSKVRRPGRHPSHKVAPKPDTTGRKLSAKERRLLAAMGGKVGAGKLPTARKGGARKAGPGRQITAGEIGSLQRRNRYALKACYQRSLKRDSSLKDIKAVIRVSVAPSGIIRSVSVSGVSDFSLRTCLQRNVKRWVFKAVGGSQSQTIEFPLIFRGS